MIWHKPWIYLIFCLVSLQIIWTNFTIPLGMPQSTQPESPGGKRYIFNIAKLESKASNPGFKLTEAIN